MPTNETAVHQRQKRQRLMQSLSTVLSSTINKIITTKIVINFPTLKNVNQLKRETNDIFFCTKTTNGLQV